MGGERHMTERGERPGRQTESSSSYPFERISTNGWVSSVLMGAGF